MKNKIKPIIVRNAGELARALALTPADAIDMEIRSRINDKIVEAAGKSGLTHAQIAKAAGTSRSRLTAIINRDRGHVSTDLMLRILATLGYQTRISFIRVRRAA